MESNHDHYQSHDSGVVIESFHSSAPDYFPPQIWVESWRGIYLSVVCLGQSPSLSKSDNS